MQSNIHNVVKVVKKRKKKKECNVSTLNLLPPSVCVHSDGEWVSLAVDDDGDVFAD